MLFRDRVRVRGVQDERLRQFSEVKNKGGRTKQESKPASILLQGQGQHIASPHPKSRISPMGHREKLDWRYTIPPIAI